MSKKFLVILSIYLFNLFAIIGFPAFILTASQHVMAGSLPWEGPLCNLATSLTGPTAKAIAMVGLFVAGGLLVFGGELGDFARRITWMCLAIATMMLGASLITALGLSSSSTC